jgi:lysophospholipase L1-like esterase
LFNNAAREISQEYNIALVDNERFFEEEAKHTDIEQFFTSDGHCNEYGYRIIAENTYRELIERKLLPGKL